jgi:hypothetical protein
VHVRVERSVGLDLDETLLLERVAKRTLHEPYTFDERSLLVPLGRFERPLEVVENGQELAHEPFVCMRDEALVLTRRPLAEVVEVRLDALGEREVLVASGLDLGQSRGQVGRRTLWLGATRSSWLASLLASLLGHVVCDLVDDVVWSPGGHERLVSSSSMTSKSASSTTSSSDTAESPLPEGCDCAAAVACA